MIQREEWKDIKGFEGIYQISSYGRVRSLSRLISYGNYVRKYRGKILSPYKTVYGYLQVPLRNVKRGSYKAPIHQLVAQAFIPNPQHFTEIHHKDYDKTNNHVENLMWCSRQFNQNDMTRHYKKNKIVGCCEDCGIVLKDSRNNTGLCRECLVYERGMAALKRHGISSYMELRTLIAKHGVASTAKAYGYTLTKLKLFCKNHGIAIDNSCKTEPVALQA